MIVSVNKFAKLLHLKLIKDKVLNPSSYVNTPRNYKKMLQEVATVVLTSENKKNVTEVVSNLSYFNFRNNSDKFLMSAFSLKRDLISLNKKKEELKKEFVGTKETKQVD